MTNSGMNWQPGCSAEMLGARHRLLRQIRSFFDSRGFIEVETPLLGNETMIDRHIDPVPVQGRELGIPALAGSTLFLQTSPEFAMKRLLAAGCGPVYQICKAFRAGEMGPMHNPEFTILEWYHPGLGYREGREQLKTFAESLLGRTCSEITYRHLFEQECGFNPHSATLEEMIAAAHQRLPQVHWPAGVDRDGVLDGLMAEIVRQGAGSAGPWIIHDWPESQAALARTREVDGQCVAERYELYCDGIELANGYCELLDADELERRMACNQAVRLAHGRPLLPAGGRLAGAMRAGLPASCGVALGVDRLLMAITGAASIREVIGFTTDRA